MEKQEKKLVNRNLNLTFEQYCSMGQDLTQYSLGDYVIEQKIGEGAFGRVYKGFNQKTRQKVAIKTINFQMLFATYRDPTLSKILQLVKTQDVLMRICKSDNIVKCFQVFQNQSLKIIVMEYCSGGTLQNYIKSNGRIPEKQALKILKQILNGISEMHSRSIVHRDLKPENVLIHEGIFKIADFGFSKQLQASLDDGITVVGTRPYMAPQIINKVRYGLKVDIWSAAVILYQMVFGQHPFKQIQKFRLLNQMKNNQLYKQKRIVANGYTASQQISTFLKRMLVIDQKQRIGWEELLKDPILNCKEQNNRLPRSLVVDYQIHPPSQRQEPSIINQTEQDYSALLGLVEKKGRDSTDLVIKKVGKNSIMIKKNNLKIQEDDIYLQMNRNLIQCLKNQLIYNQVILKIQQLGMLDLQQRITIDLLYLLSQRCFLNMSPINQRMKKIMKNHIFIEQIYQIVKNLYNKMKRTYEKYGQMLTEQQNKLFNRFKEFFFSQEKSNVFFNGIENKDYKRQDHLKFTQQNYINEIKNDLKGSFSKVDKVRRYLLNYQLINRIKFETLIKTNFDNYIQKIVQD